jgi:hypothetical protein
VVIAIIGVLIALLLPAVQAAREDYFWKKSPKFFTFFSEFSSKTLKSAK